MRRALVVVVMVGGLFAGCGRADPTALRCDDPGDGSALVAACDDDGLLFCRTEDGQRCQPTVVACFADGDFECQTIPGLLDTSLEAICLVGDFDREDVLRTTPRCSEIAETPSP